MCQSAVTYKNNNIIRAASGLLGKRCHYRRYAWSSFVSTRMTTRHDQRRRREGRGSGGACKRDKSARFESETGAGGGRRSSALAAVTVAVAERHAQAHRVYVVDADAIFFRKTPAANNKYIFFFFLWELLHSNLL